jgi:hypothetical protein
VVAAVVPVLVALKSEKGAASVIADIAVRVPVFKDATLEQLAPAVRGLEDLTSPSAGGRPRYLRDPGCRP